MKHSKKGQALQQLSIVATGVAVLAISLSVVFLILAQAKTQIASIEGIENISNYDNCTTSAACNATSSLQVAVSDIPGWVPLIIIASVGGILLGLVKLFQR